jgi:hypothetical protein
LRKEDALENIQHPQGVREEAEQFAEQELSWVIGTA